MFWDKKQQKDNKGNIEETLSRGVVEIIGEEKLRRDIESEKNIKIKLGIDPTGKNIHLGHTIPLLKLRDFQKLGHTATLIIGDATGVVGDTSDKDSERPMLSRKETEENKKTYIQQAQKIIDIRKTEIEYNSKWLDKLTFDEIGEQADQFSVSDFISRDNIKRRLDAGKRVSLREMIYPLMQGYDSVAIESDVEIGGTDQRFNLLAGRTLQKHYGQEEQSVVMGELLLGTDGKKMSKSAGNTINIFDTPEDMFGKSMRVNDELVKKYFILTTRVSMDKVEKIMEGHPRDSKIKLAYELVRMYHGENKANKARQNFINTFSEGNTPINPEEIKYIDNLQKTLVESKIIKSNTEFRRLLNAGAIKNLSTGEVFTKPDKVLSKDTVVKIGKKNFVKIIV